MSVSELITLITAALGLILSVLQWIYTLYSKRTNFSMSIEKFEFHTNKSYNRAIFTLMIWNNSSAPLTITRMSINNVNCLIKHQWVGDRYYPDFPENDIPRTERELSPDFPITIAAHGGGLYPIIFDFDPNTTLDKLIPIIIQTSNCRKKFILFCPEYDKSKLYF